MTQSIPPASIALEAALPLDAELLDGGVVNLVAAADEEHHAFLVGRFERLLHPDWRGDGGGNLLEGERGRFAVRVFRVGHDSLQRLSGGGRHFHIAAPNAPHTHGGEEVLAIQDGVVEEGLLPRLDIDDEKALQHWLIPPVVVVTEGATTARNVAMRMVSDAHAERIPSK